MKKTDEERAKEAEERARKIEEWNQKQRNYIESDDFNGLEISKYDGFVRCPSHISVERLKKIIPWYVYNGQEVVIVDSDTVNRMSLKPIDWAYRTRDRGWTRDRDWTRRTTKALVSLEEVSKSGIHFFQNILAPNGNHIMAAWEPYIEADALWIHADLNERLKDLKKRYEIWLSYNGSEIVKKDVIYSSLDTYEDFSIKKSESEE